MKNLDKILGPWVNNNNKAYSDEAYDRYFLNRRKTSYCVWMSFKYKKWMNGLRGTDREFLTFSSKEEAQNFLDLELINWGYSLLCQEDFDKLKMLI